MQTPTYTKPWQCAALPLWVRVGWYGIEHHGQPHRRGELRTTLDPLASAADVSRAIKRAVAAGLLAHDSSARCLYARAGR